MNISKSFNHNRKTGVVILSLLLFNIAFQSQATAGNRGGLRSLRNDIRELQNQDQQVTSQLVVTQVIVDDSGDMLMINGINFDNGDFPVVELGGQELVVTSSDGQVITADLPLSFIDSSYMLTVSTGSKRSQFDSFELTLGAVGEQGEAGPQGQTGEAGPQGQQGVGGLAGPQGQQGIRGPAGPQGSAGPVGPQGPRGSVTLRLVRNDEIAITAGEAARLIVNCPINERPVSGGFVFRDHDDVFSNFGQFVQRFRFVSNGPSQVDPTSWIVIMVNNTDTTGVGNAYAYCAPRFAPV